MSDMSGAGQESIGTPTPESSAPSQVSPEEGSEFYSGFLKNVAPIDRPVVQKYLKDWDSGVNQRFREKDAEYKPYKDLGEVEALQAAKQVYDMLNNDPMAVYNWMGTELQKMGLLQQIQEQQEPAQQIPSDEFEGLPQGVIEKLNKMDQLEQLVMAMGNKLLQGDTQAQEARENAELDSYLNQLKSQLGDFDEHYVLSKMYSGMDGVEAVKSYQKLINDGVAASLEKRGQIPTVLGGNGAVPTSSVDPANLTRQESKDALMQFLARGQQNR